MINPFAISLPSLRQSALACALTLLSSLALAQEVRDLGPSLQSVPADLVPSSPEAHPDEAPAQDLGEDLSAGAGVAAEERAAARQPSRVDQAIVQAQALTQAQSRSKPGDKTIRKPPARMELTRHGTERVLFERAPIKVPLPVGAERLIVLPAPAALHVPSDMHKVARLEVIDRTLYATAKVPFTTLRVIAELIDSGQQIPLDLVADSTTSSALAELEVFLAEPSAAQGPAAQAAAAAMNASGAAADGGAASQMADSPPADMVQLTRYAARQLYAPKRLASPVAGVQQVAVAAEPLTDLFRGVEVLSTPVGQWRSGQLYVTAVLVKNRARLALEVPLEQLRGDFLAASAQHGRIGPAGTDTDTTAVYLVCERRFEACR